MRTAVFPQPLHWKAVAGACAAASADACRPWAAAASFCFPAAVQAEQRRQQERYAAGEEHGHECRNHKSFFILTLLELKKYSMSRKLILG